MTAVEASSWRIVNLAVELSTTGLTLTTPPTSHPSLFPTSTSSLPGHRQKLHIEVQFSYKSSCGPVAEGFKRRTRLASKFAQDRVGFIFPSCRAENKFLLKASPSLWDALSSQHSVPPTRVRRFKAIWLLCFDLFSEDRSPFSGAQSL